MRWPFVALLLCACSNELSFGYLRAGDASTSFACDERGASFAVGDGDPRCPGFHHALCACGDYVSSGSTRVTGALALGGLLTAGDLTIDGPLTLAGEPGAALTGELRVTGALLDRGPLQGNTRVVVGGDARVAGDVRLMSLQVAGALTLGDGAALEIGDGNLPAATRAPVDVPAPCDCTPVLDVGAQIDRARAENDNAAIRLDPALGLRTFEAARVLDLPCGRYYVEQIYAASPLALNVHGRVALYVDQRIVTEASGALTITTDDGAQLELFVRRGVTGAGPITIAGGETHLYVGGNDSFFFAAPTSIAATLYAPASELVTQQRFVLEGAALLQRVVAEQELSITQTVPRCD